MNIINFETIDSTSTYAKKNILNLEDKTVVSANFQSNGYGRFERAWVDLGVENIYMTFVLKPSDKIMPVFSNLTQYLSVCLCRELLALGIQPQIKWPNDVLINGKKVCGILAESVTKSGKLQGIVVGIGVNLNADLAGVSSIDRPATSLNLELGYNVDKKEFMAKLINRFFENYDEFLQAGFPMIKEDYVKYSTFLNRKLTVSIFKTIKHGVSVGIGDDGTLLLQNTDGIVENINMGEIV